MPKRHLQRKKILGGKNKSNFLKLYIKLPVRLIYFPPYLLIKNGLQVTTGTGHVNG